MFLSATNEIVDRSPIPSATPMDAGPNMDGFAPIARSRKHNEMRTPGFTAEASLARPSGPFQSTLLGVRDKSQQELAAQLAGSSFPGSFGGLALGGLEDYWVCVQGCDNARSACFETCEGTWENPKPSRNCILCDQQYNACVQGCSRDIA